MTEHYYNENPTVEHDEKFIKVAFYGKEFIFKTDSGVFSKNRIDYGSNLLIETFKIPDKKVKILDLGCGYGPIGIILGSVLKNGEIIMTDINERAVALAALNISLNANVITKTVSISVIQSSGFSNIDDDEFDFILLNPPIRAGKEVVYQLYGKLIII